MGIASPVNLSDRIAEKADIIYLHHIGVKWNYFIIAASAVECYLLASMAGQLNIQSFHPVIDSAFTGYGYEHH
jgi:hypothetical protein